MKLLKHKFDQARFDKSLYDCIQCGKFWADIRYGLDDINKYYDLMANVPYFPTRIDYLNEHSSVKCITEDEFIIKSIIE